MRHLGLDGLAGLGDGGADLLADRVGLDDVVGAVDLREALAFGALVGLMCLLAACLSLEGCCMMVWIIA